MTEGERADHVSRRLDVAGESILDDETWQTPAALESLRDIIKNLDQSFDAISGWSSMVDQEGS